MKTWTEWSQSLSSPKKRSRLSLTHAGGSSLSTRSAPESAFGLTSSPAGGWNEVVLRWWVLNWNAALDPIRPLCNPWHVVFSILVSFLFSHDVRSEGFVCLFVSPFPFSSSEAFALSVHSVKKACEACASGPLLQTGELESCPWEPARRLCAVLAATAERGPCRPDLGAPGAAGGNRRPWVGPSKQRRFRASETHTKPWNRGSGSRSPRVADWLHCTLRGPCTGWQWRSWRPHPTLRAGRQIVVFLNFILFHLAATVTPRNSAYIYDVVF